MSENEASEHTGRMIRDEIRIAAPPEAIYKAWSDPESITAWLVGRMEGRMEVGETVTWHWDEIEGVMEIKAFRGPHRGSKVGIRMSSWMEDAAELGDLDGRLPTVVGKLTSMLTQAAS